jgi:hypothetical protein
MRIEEITVRFRYPVTHYEVAGLVPGPETCFRCHVEFGTTTRDRLDEVVRCVDDSGNEYDYHLDEPEGAGL